MTAEQQLDKFLAKFTPEVAATARRALIKMRKRLPGAVEIVYDNYNALAIGFGPSERASEAIFSIALYPRYVSLFFLQGAKLSDPHRRLQGSGNVVRYIKLNDLDVLDEANVRSLMDEALRNTKVPIDPKKRRQMIIKSVSAKQRPRRPAKNSKASLR
ncbi:MAG TPA: DUF1801 domain-containing protein [Terriglobales bacterium]|jgi:hypothetical protein